MMQQLSHPTLKLSHLMSLSMSIYLIFVHNVFKRGLKVQWEKPISLHHFMTIWLSFGQEYSSHQVNSHSDLITWLSKVCESVLCSYDDLFSTPSYISKYFVLCLTQYQLQISHLMAKPAKWQVHPAKTHISLVIRPVWSDFTVRKKKARVLSYPMSAQWRLIKLGGCPGWSKSSLGTVILLVLSWGGSDVFRLVYSHMQRWQFKWRWLYLGIIRFDNYETCNKVHLWQSVKASGTSCVQQCTLLQQYKVLYAVSSILNLNSLMEITIHFGILEENK